MTLKALFDTERMREIRADLKKGEAGAFRKAEPATERADEGAGIPASEASAAINRDLLQAVSSGRLEEAREALSKGANPNSRSSVGMAMTVNLRDFSEEDPGSMSQGKTALIIAVEKGDKSMAELLIEAGADVNASTNYGSYPYPTPLSTAMRRGNGAMSELLKRHGARD